MLRLKLLEYSQKSEAPDIQQLLDAVLTAQTSISACAANKLFLDRVGFDLQETRSEGYYQQSLHYHLALLYAHLGQPERAAEHMAQSNTLPATGGDQLFSEHVGDSFDLAKQQESACDRGMPPLLITAMPRSASASFTQTLSKLLDMPVMRLSIGQFLLVPSWLKVFAKGGALTHDHFAATEFNIEAIVGSGIRDLFILVRDPRSAATSARVRAASHVLRQTGEQVPAAEVEADVLTVFEKRYAPWLQGWLSCAARPPSPLRVHVIRSTDVRTRMAAVVRDLLARLQPDYPALAALADAPVTEVKANFVKGDDEAWRDRISASGQQRMWDLMPAQAASFLGLVR